MRRAVLTTLTGIWVVCACGARTSIEDYGYGATSRRDSVIGASGQGGRGTGGSGGDNRGGRGGDNRGGAVGAGAAGAGATGVGATGGVVVSPPPPMRPEITCNPLIEFFDSQIVSGVLGSGTGAFQSSCGGMGLEQHYSFVAPYPGVFTFDTLGSAIDTVLSVNQTDCFGTELTCNDDFGGVPSHVEVSLVLGQQVTVRVDDYGGGGGEYLLRGHGTGDLSCAPYELGSSLGSSIVSGSLTAELAGQATVCGGSGPTFAARWTAPVDGTFLFDTIGSNFDTILAINASCDGGSLACNDDYSGLASGVTPFLFAGQSVLLMLQALGNSAQPGSDSYVLNIQQTNTFQ